jgi:hypothetical protein
MALHVKDDRAAIDGRPARVLHIGNIGNNAYILSGALNAVGVASDVLCPDAYHIMGCPEWEDADFAGDVGNAFFPAWENVDLRGFARPRWFAQGPVPTCLHYLKARRSGDEYLADRCWQDLERQRVRSCAFQRRPLLVALATWLGRARRFARRTLVRSARSLEKWVRSMPGKEPIARVGAVPSERGARRDASSFTERVQDLVASFRAIFPERSDVLTNEDMPVSADIFDLWRETLEEYDLVVGYSTDGIYPLLVNRPYFAFEHGTIRSIPFEATGQGRLCALTYRLALHTFITNADNHLAAEKLGLPSYSFLPHPLNDHDVDAADTDALRQELCGRLQSDFIVLHPARQHWTADRHPSWEKGNDFFIEGFARFVREDNPRAAAVFVNWGQTVDASRALLQERGVADRVLWIEPQANRRLLAYIRATDAVADQFFLGSFGGIMPKALRLGRPCFIALDEERHRWCFPEMPPMIQSRTPEEIHVGLRRLYRDAEYARRFAVDGPRWYAKYHSLDVVVDRFLTEMRKLVDSKPTLRLAS